MKISLPEIVAAGVYNSDVAHKNKTITKNRKTTMFEIELPMENGGISYINDVNNPITTNCFVCAKPGQMRHTKLPYKCYYIHIMVNSGGLYDTLNSLSDYLHVKDRAPYEEIFKKMCKYYESGIYEDTLMLQSLILKLTYMLHKENAKQKSTAKTKANNHLVINKAIEYIKENLTSDLKLETVAKTVSLSPIHFHNCFKASTGKTLQDYVEEQRIKKAVNLLLTTDMPLTRIAFECGFSSQSYFSFVFKRRMKTTPRSYVKQINENYDKNKDLF